jgi:hypothetical protein
MRMVLPVRPGRLRGSRGPGHTRVRSVSIARSSSATVVYGAGRSAGTGCGRRYARRARRAAPPKPVAMACGAIALAAFVANAAYPANVDPHVPSSLGTQPASGRIGATVRGARRCRDDSDAGPTSAVERLHVRVRPRALARSPRVHAPSSDWTPACARLRGSLRPRRTGHRRRHRPRGRVLHEPADAPPRSCARCCARPSHQGPAQSTIDLRLAHTRPNRCSSKPSFPEARLQIFLYRATRPQRHILAPMIGHGRKVRAARAGDADMRALLTDLATPEIADPLEDLSRRHLQRR